MTFGNRFSVGCCCSGTAFYHIRCEYDCPGCTGTGCRRNVPNGDVVTIKNSGVTIFTGTVGTGGILAIPVGILPAPTGSTVTLPSSYRATIADAGIQALGFAITSLAIGSVPGTDYVIIAAAKTGQTFPGGLCA